MKYYKVGDKNTSTKMRRKDKKWLKMYNIRQNEFGKGQGDSISAYAVKFSKLQPAKFWSIYLRKKMPR